ncbi:hypothetical protein P691DRAFT_773575 [Macrolepiota fuliginosa MF-IS2]|uniref:Amidohydrolase 3 domain-containing protein n=1 Tax=Macrolepiota fuliginosa MF-IS2 TaxID=1400762 RepID=A0A9P5XJX4_9AGAR|nr:hypothetical protein P691DRAFT_773575 [Macrolepiota fuliginosa MF-IS2]
MASTIKPQRGVQSPQRRKAHLNLFLLTTTITALAVYVFHDLLTEYTLCSPTGRVYTVDEAQPEVQCISIRNDRILRVGAHSDVTTITVNVPVLKRSFFVKRPRVSYVGSADIIVPGLTDAHAHVIENGWMLQLPLMGSISIQEIIDRIKEYIQSRPDILNDPNRWIEGMGWDQTKWEDKKFPTAEDLDQDPLLKGRPISLIRVDGHARWVSTRVLNLMGTLPDDDEVIGGRIIRDPHGNPTGVFVDNAVDLIPTPPWTENQMEEYFSATMKLALQFGLTSIHDADTKLPMIDFFKRKAEEGAIPLRLYLLGGVTLPRNSSETDIAGTATHILEDWKHGIPRFINYGKQGRLTLRGVKLYADGALGSWGAALLAPYSDNPSTQGILLQPPEVLRAAVRRYWGDNMQVGIHCIGDRGNRIALDIFEELIEEKGVNVSEWRPRIEHAQIFELHDLKRVGKLGVIASVQPTHATSDMWYAENRLGPDRIKGAYAYATLLQTSGHNVLPLGSDFPIEGVNPLLGFYAAVKRLAVDGTSPHGPTGWQVIQYPNEGLTRKEALKGMTLDAAYASFQEHEIGSLEVGKKADFVVFDRDFVGCIEDVCDGSEILAAKVKAVVIDGKVAWGTLPQSEAEARIFGVMERLMAYAKKINWL